MVWISGALFGSAPGPPCGCGGSRARPRGACLVMLLSSHILPVVEGVLSKQGKTFGLVERASKGWQYGPDSGTRGVV